MDEAAAADDELSRTVDLRGLRCPLPALHTRRALGRLAPGRSLIVLCTDPLAGLDIPHLAAETGDALVEAAWDGRAWRFVIRRRAPPGGEDPTGNSPR